MDRRDVLRLSAAAGAAGVLTLRPVVFARAEDGGRGGEEPRGEQSRTVRGHLPTGAPDFVYLPVEVPRGVREIAVSYTYDRPAVPAGTPGNALDIGIFDERGTAPGGRGFRGWSGGFRSEFAISAWEATPGYLPGPVRPGTWHVVLGPYTVAPQGMEYEVTVTLRYGEPGRTPRPAYPPERAAGRGRAWYRGDCHLHTVHSDGRRTPAEVAAAAREAGLDFIATTEHNTTSGHAAWEGLWGDDLLILCGEEVTTRNGHFLALGTDPGTFVDWRYRARDDAYERYVRTVHRAGGLVVPAHPSCPFVGCQWKFGYAGADAVEVWNGPWTADDELALAAWDNLLVASCAGGRAGRGGDGGRGWIPAMGNSDAHREPQAVGAPQTVVHAADLSRPAVLEAIRAGRSWLAESSAVGLALSATGPRGEHAGIGERLRVAPDAEVAVRLEVSGVPGGTVRLMTDQGEMHAARLPSSGAGTAVWRTTASLAAYVRAEVRHPRPEGAPAELPGAMAAMTNPLWLEAR
ncbi:CehA/McbA family metallohydrolase [Streptomyces desertarenae]|uniref:CehA/McbA family metallohydrolase n=1 Tax=Streptomyces desertarenae TaxID=2666184 RepID=A0ABW4PFL9_9ACTN